MKLGALGLLCLLGVAGVVSASETNPAAALQRADKKADLQGHKQRTSTHKAGKGHVSCTTCMLAVIAG